MTRYAFAYRVGFAPWERYAVAAAARIRALLAREEADRPTPPGRALDLGCGRGVYTRQLARRGWEAVGIDAVPRAIEAARRGAVPGARFVVGDVTDLPAAGLGTFDLFLDVGCFQGLDAAGRRAEGAGVSALANAGATLLVLAFGPTCMRWSVGGASRAEVEAAFAGWDVLSVEQADTAGLGWPLNRTSPQWYRLRLRSAGGAHRPPSPGSVLPRRRR
ncbi:class I SAM-dependent methyltransferase [Blastococcus sp. SYSU DS0533]